MAAFDDLPIKPKFAVGDEVFYYVEDASFVDEAHLKDCRRFGKIRNIRASVKVFDKNGSEHIVYGYTLDPMPTFGTIEEAALYFVNPLLRFTREVHDGD
jgi:hypothetical protein